MMPISPRGIQITDTPIWKAVNEIYLQDRVVEALEQAEEMGGFDSNSIAAEAEVRKEGRTWNVRKWLTVEAIPSETGSSFQAALDAVASECEELSNLFGWDNHEATLVTFLPRDYSAEWMPGRWGYYIDKFPYDKVCLPSDLLENLPRLRRAVRHEFMHVITHNLCGGHDPRWLAEAMSTLVEGRVSAHSWEHFKANQETWLGPTALVSMLTTDLRDPASLETIGYAYDQASFLGLFLYLDGGAGRLSALLRGVGDESLLLNLELEALSRTRTDGALRRVYHVSEPDLFNRTLAWVRTASMPKPAF
ncbi:MAG TPA: hypothetical protein VMI31_00370 [Fimbriimonadaceae bacterium]|nr:hypothetical protein [Fimbriimonadaceae bacterium]